MKTTTHGYSAYEDVRKDEWVETMRDEMVNDLAFKLCHWVNNTHMHLEMDLAKDLAVSILEAQ